MYCYGGTIHNECYLSHVCLKIALPWSWGSLLGEHSTSLKDCLFFSWFWWNYHLNCSNLMVVLLSGPSYSSCGETFSFLGWSMISKLHDPFRCALYFDKWWVGCNVIYCNPESGHLMSCNVWRICGVTGVVYHGMTCDCPWCAEWDHLELLLWWLCLSHCCGLEQPLCKSQWLELWCLLYLDCDLDQSLPSSIFPVVPWAQSGVAISVCLVVWCQCSWRRYSMRAVHDDMSIFIAFMTSDVRAVACNMSWFLALEVISLPHLTSCWPLKMEWLSW